MSRLLIVVDYQNDFVTGSLGSIDCEEIEGNVYECVKGHLNEGFSVIFTKDTHYDNYLETQEGITIPITHCIKDSNGHRIYGKIEDLSLHKNATIIEKNQFGVNNTDFLGDFKDIGEFIVIGVATNICVLSNVIILQNRYPNKKITLISNCCASYNRELHDNTLDIMKALGINVI